MVKYVYSLDQQNDNRTRTVWPNQTAKRGTIIRTKKNIENKKIVKNKAAELLMFPEKEKKISNKYFSTDFAATGV